MEIAQPQNKTLRVLAKLVLLGLAVVLLAKVFLILLVLSVVGLLTCIIAKTLYRHGSAFRRISYWSIEKLIHSFARIFQAGIVTSKAVHLDSGLVWSMAYTLRALLVVACTLLIDAAKICWCMTWKGVQSFLVLAYLGLLSSLRHSKEVTVVLSRASLRGCAAAAGVATASLTMLRNQSSLICGTFVEACSGALLATMLAFIFSSVPPERPMDARFYGAALFGAFLGLTVSLSRTTCPKQGEPDQRLENQN